MSGIVFLYREENNPVIDLYHYIADHYVISGGIPDGTKFGTGTVFVLVELSVCLLFWIGNYV